MLALDLYHAGRRVFSVPLSPNQGMEALGEVISLWIASASRPRVILTQGNVARIVRIEQNGG